MDQSPRSAWNGEFGEAYTHRNASTVQTMDQLYSQRFGVSRTKLNKNFLGHIDRDIRILEVGCNVGVQLECLQQLGFENVHGIDIQDFAVQTAHQEHPELDIIRAGGSDIPFKDGYFDLVFTSGVLIHIPPDDVQGVMEEIVRCSSRFVYGYEYYADEYEEIEYRGNDGLLWKADFPQMYQDSHGLTLQKSRKLQYPESDNEDVLFLLEN